MARYRVGEIGISDQLQSSNHFLAYGVHGMTQAANNFLFEYLTFLGYSCVPQEPLDGLDQEGAAYFGELEEALMQGAVGIGTDEERKSFHTARPPTLEIFPSWPIRSQHSPRQGRSQPVESTDSGSAQNTISQLDSDSPLSRKDSPGQSAEQQQQQQQRGMMANEASRSGSAPNNEPTTQVKRKAAGSTTQKDEKTRDAKTLRRLAQNREAARKSRLRKKAYIQQLEYSRIKLQQVEQDLQRARSQGLFLGGGGCGADKNISSAIFDTEYGRWLNENHKHMMELRGGLQAHLPDNDLKLLVDECLSHYDEIFRLKEMVAKSDVFHLITGKWKTTAERCFLWIGGFRPSELFKILVPELEPLTEQQLVGICNLQQSSQQAEEALSQGLEQLHQSLAETVASGSLGDEGNDVGNYMGHMAIALEKLINLEGFVRQADNLRQQTLHQMLRILTIRQAARCFLAIEEYYNRLRALSSLWASQPRENLIGDERACPTSTEMQIIYQQIHNPL